MQHHKLIWYIRITVCPMCTILYVSSRARPILKSGLSSLLWWVDISIKSCPEKLSWQSMMTFRYNMYIFSNMTSQRTGRRAFCKTSILKTKHQYKYITLMVCYELDLKSMMCSRMYLKMAGANGLSDWPLSLTKTVWIPQTPRPWIWLKSIWKDFSLLKEIMVICLQDSIPQARRNNTTRISVHVDRGAVHWSYNEVQFFISPA